MALLTTDPGRTITARIEPLAKELGVMDEILQLSMYLTPELTPATLKKGRNEIQKILETAWKTHNPEGWTFVENIYAVPYLVQEQSIFKKDVCSDRADAIKQCFVRNAFTDPADIERITANNNQIIKEIVAKTAMVEIRPQGVKSVLETKVEYGIQGYRFKEIKLQEAIDLARHVEFYRRYGKVSGQEHLPTAVEVINTIYTIYYIIMKNLSWMTSFLKINSMGWEFNSITEPYPVSQYLAKIGISGKFC